MQYTWLIGKNINIDIIWGYSNFEIIKTVEKIKNINLFEEKNYKYIFQKEHINFFKTERRWETNLLIKGIEKFDSNFMLPQDEILYVDNMKKSDLFEYFIKKNNLFDLNNSKEIDFIKNNAENLNDIITLHFLKIFEINQKYWQNFLNQTLENWNQKLKNNQLLEEGVLNNSIIPELKYAINANYKKKALLLFIDAQIKSGYQIWQLNNFWKSAFNS